MNVQNMMYIYDSKIMARKMEVDLTTHVSFATQTYQHNFYKDPPLASLTNKPCSFQLRVLFANTTLANKRRRVHSFPFLLFVSASQT